jgi:hypothetical protein
MKKTKYVAISAVVAVFVALALVSSATAVPITNSQPINESLQRRERMNDILNRFDAEKLEQKMNTNLFRRFNRGGAIEFDAENYTKEDIEREMRNLFDVEAIQQMIEEADIEELDDEQMQGIFDNLPFYGLFCLFVEVGMLLFGQNFVGFYFGYFTAVIVLAIPMYLCLLIFLLLFLLIEIPVIFFTEGIIGLLTRGLGLEEYIRKYGIIGTFFFLIITLLYVLIAIPIYYVLAIMASFIITIFLYLLALFFITDQLSREYGYI